MVKKKLTLMQKRAITGILFISPWLIGFIWFYVRSFIMAIQFSLSKLTVIENGGFTLDFIGLDNFKYAFLEDPTFNQILVQSVKDMIIDVPLIIFFSLFVAILLNQKFKGRTLVRAIFFLPVIMNSGAISQTLALAQAAASGGVAAVSAEAAAVQGVNVEYFMSLFLDLGFPKAILHKHQSLSHSAKVEQNHHGQTKDDVFLCIPPLYHTGAKMHWFGSLISGSKAVLLKGVKPEWIIKCVSEEHCTIVWLLVPWAQDILDAIDSGEINLDKYQLSQWRLMHIGAQPVPPSLISRWKKHFPHHLYDTNYGLSESIGPGCVHLGVENINKVGAIGKSGYGWETKIVDENRNAVKQGEVGELAVKGPGVMTCYYKDEKATRETLQGGWLFTGDMAKESEDGFIYLVDRKKDVIITGGENLYPVQIEDFLRKNDAIKDVAVIGLPDQRLGEIAAAVIEVKPGAALTEDEVNEFCRALPRYQRPRKVIFAEVPRNPTGKIEKPKLRKMYGAEQLVAQQNEIKA